MVDGDDRASDSRGSGCVYSRAEVVQVIRIILRYLRNLEGQACTPPLRGHDE